MGGTIYIVSQEAGYIQEGGNRSQDEQANPFGIVDLDHIQALINDEAAIDKTYTFAMIPPEHITDEFSNLIVRIIDGEIIRAYINVYTPTPEYLTDYGLVPGNAYSGAINSYALEGSGIDLERSVINKLGEGLTPVKTIAFADGSAFEVIISEDCDPPDPPDHTDDNSNDDPNDSNNNNTGGGGEPDEPDNDHQDTGTTDQGNGDPDGPIDGGGGDIICIEFIDVGGCCERNICNPHPPALPEPLCSGVNAVVIDCYNTHNVADDTEASPDRSVEVDHTDCPDDDVVVIGPPQEDPPTIEELCANIENEQLSDQVFQDVVDDMEDHTNQMNELGFALDTDGDYRALPNNANGNLDYPIESDDVGFVHIHLNDYETGRFDIYGNPEERRPIRIFSPRDILSFLRLINLAIQNNRPLEDVYGAMFSSQRDYFLKFNGNPDQIASFIASIETTDIKTLNDTFGDYVLRYSNEEAFFRFIRDELNIPLDAGVELFRVRNNGDIEHKFFENEEVDEEDCND